ncbi:MULTISPECIES: hypothetical protein [unclassified Lentimonas]|uniref:hypothetical protein n=1 Tax=unclassified Lentimonas TaxID=2630993 RepID=UPI0013283334|nr:MULTISPECIES: hypothetical protein [unclassified Lentimonas]CAA6690130.1 Unannotated [Lentimonas sp. CC19]CAA6690908.1 Unannotated [Lentimonas sp. CC10]CAA7070740.1 Unannotated [Lentimonas sp. CC11]
MKTLIILIFAGVLGWQAFKNPQLLPIDFVSKDPRQSYITISDINDRTIDCKLISKRGNYIYIEREQDQQRFPLHLDKLAPASRSHFDDIEEFNMEPLNEAIYPLALEATTIELLSIPSHYYTICSSNGQRIKSCHAIETEAYRTFLQDHNYRYKEKSIKVTEISDNRYQLPIGITKVPCIRIAGIDITKRHSKAVKTALIDSYINSW